MPRTARDASPGIHHVYSRGNGGQDIFRTGADAHEFLRLLRLIAADEGWLVLSFSLLPNHFHIIVETTEANLGDGMRRLCSRYARAFHDAHGSYGHLCQGRYGSRPVREQTYFVHLLRYVALNPVAANLCRRPEDWPWSAHSTLITGRGERFVAWRRTWELLEPQGGRPAGRYAALFDPDGPHGPWETAFSPYPPRPSLEQLIEGRPHDEAMRLARWEHGYSLREIAEATGWSVPTASRRTRGVK